MINSSFLMLLPGILFVQIVLTNPVQPVNPVSTGASDNYGYRYRENCIECCLLSVPKYLIMAPLVLALEPDSEMTGCQKCLAVTPCTGPCVVCYLSRDR